MRWRWWVLLGLEDMEGELGGVMAAKVGLATGLGRRSLVEKAPAWLMEERREGNSEGA